MKDLDAAFEQAVQWRNNCFKVPQGSAGKLFVKELSRLFNAFARESALEPVALKATIVLPCCCCRNHIEDPRPRNTLSALSSD